MSWALVPRGADLLLIPRKKLEKFKVNAKTTTDISAPCNHMEKAKNKTQDADHAV